MAPFVVLVSDLLHRPAAQRHVALDGVLDGLASGIAKVPPPGRVELDGTLAWVQDGLLFTGTVAATWSSECRRCLIPVEGTLSTQVQELFWLYPPEPDAFRIAHENVDFSGLARESVVLELPTAPLCRPDCAGLCAYCGADLNQGRCGCVEDRRDPRWEALDALRAAGSG